MNWWPTTCKPGDMIRVHIGSIEHYGIFVSEEEVIQFGLPPIPEYRKPDEEIVVLSTDIDTFSCGNIVEVAEYDKKEAKKAFPKKKTVELAKGRLGESGYNFIHNNCEHFANECVFGIKRSSQEENARKKWNSRPILDVYIAEVPEQCEYEAVYPESREREIAKVKHDETKRQKYIAWKTLKQAIQHSFRMQMEELDFKQDKYGRWLCDELIFSISHTEGAVAVAVSNGAVGVDIENLAVAESKYADKVSALRKRAYTAKESAEYPEETVDALMTAWTRKESLFKGFDGSRFRPERVETVGENVDTHHIRLKEDMILSVCGEKLAVVAYYYCDGQSAHILGRDAIEDGKPICGE